jgi:hypothetical protein
LILNESQYASTDTSKHAQFQITEKDYKIL